MKTFSYAGLLIPFFICCQSKSVNADSAYYIKNSHIQGRMQQEKFKKAEQNPTATHIWALFSYGGWSNNGQVIIVSSKEQAQIEVIPPNRKEGVTYTISGDKWEQITSSLKLFQSLGSVNEKLVVFDGLQYEFVAASRKKTGPFKILKRIFLNNPSLDKEATKHHDMLKFFTTLRKKP